MPRKVLLRRQVLALGGAALAAGALASRGHAIPERRSKIKGVAFDAFTIFDPRSIAAVVEQAFPGRGAELSAAWKTRQFEYCWLRTLYGNYTDFWQVSRDALTFVCQAAKLELSSAVSDRLMNCLLELKPYPTSVAALKTLRDRGLRLAYLSNLTPTLLATLSRNAGIADLFEYSLSTDRVRAYKPDPRAYQMAEDAFSLSRDEILFSAFGGWDAAGAKCFGMPTFWVNPTGAPTENLGIVPDATGGSLTDLVAFAVG